MILQPKNLAGSRLACMALTSGSANQVAERLSDLVRGFGQASLAVSRLSSSCSSSTAGRPRYPGGEGGPGCFSL